MTKSDETPFSALTPGINEVEVGIDGFLSEKGLMTFENIANESGGGGDGARRDGFDVASIATMR